MNNREFDNFVESSHERSNDDYNDNNNIDFENENTSGPNHFYKYCGLDYLNKDLNDIENPDTTFSSICLCTYRVNTTGMYPFLEMILKKNTRSHPQIFFMEESLSFIGFGFLNQITNVLETSKIILDSFFHHKNVDYKFDGFFVEDDCLFLFVDCTNFTLCNAKKTYRNDHIWFVLMDEIMNHSKSVNLKIDDKVVTLFRNNTIFTYLYDENSETYESPIVAYAGRDESKLAFTATFGVSAMSNFDINAIVGPYFYFTDYDRAVQQGGWSETNNLLTECNIPVTDNEFGRYKKGGLVKFALFLGKQKVVLNLPEDPVDTSLFKNELINDVNNESKSKSLIRNTMRLTDYDALWTKEKYDSVYIGKLELDNGNTLVNAPLWVVKKYEQQTPLSYYYIDKSTLGDVWKENQSYFVV